MKKTAGKAMMGLVAVFIMLSGLVFLFAPDRAAEKLLLTPDGVTGLSNMRGFIGAPVLAVGTAILIGAITERLENARAGALFVVFLLIARITSYVVDGPTPEIALFVTIPGVVLAVLIVAHKLIESGD